MSANISPPRAILFDLDDTLLSFSVGQETLWSRIVSTHAQSFAPVSAEELTRVIEQVVTPEYWADAARAVFGRHNMFQARRQVVAQAFATLAAAVDATVVAAIADAYTNAKESLVAPLEDSLDVLGGFEQRGVRLGLITNGSSEFQRRKLFNHQLEGRFDSILIEGEWGVGKPDSSIFAEALRRIECSPDEVWMVGDNFEADIEGAASVGIAGVWVQHGRPLPRGRRAEPLACIDHVRQLLPLFDQLSHR
jgi:putative hydrolase of the HAD superfamily